MPDKDRTLSVSGAPSSSPKKASPDSDGQTTSYLVRRVMRDYLAGHIRPLLIAITFMLVTAGTTGALAWILRPAIDQLFVGKDPTLLYFIPGSVIAIMIAQAFASYIQGVLMTRIGQDVVAEMQVQLVRSMIYADLKRLNQTHTGEFLARALNNVSLVQQASSQTIAVLAKDITTIVILTGVMFSQDWKLALIAVAVIPFVILNNRRQGKKTRKATRSSMSETGNLTTLISENLDGTRVVKAYGQEEREIERTSRSIERRRHFQMKAYKARLAAAPVTEAVTGIGIAGVIFYGGWQGINGGLTIGAFMSFLSALMLSYDPLKRVSSVSTVLSQGLSAAENIFEELDKVPEIRDAEDARPLNLHKGEITFDHVTFAYGDDGFSALKDVSFTVKHGETVALVGPSGAGKSTVLNLIPRFYDASAGRVLIDGQDVRDVTLASLRKSIALVTQDPFLFDDTIYANILYGRPEATEEDVIAAAKAAAAHEFIEAMPEGYQSQAGEGGNSLSGGQRQRIAIARAILKDAPILLLDEATSALDTRSEKQVQEALEHLMENRTTIVIAHRLSTIIHADTIFVMDQGRVIESGKHGTLLQDGQLYASLYSTMLAHDPSQRKAGE
ncbi:MAG: ABC transporter ATP-binding protein [Alphaproteobacteria bacterium]|nr:MAG: ABC transporter ATP-binding protein [Alphaproteobacteria bacterium]